MVQKVGFFGILACASVSGFIMTSHHGTFPPTFVPPVDAHESELEHLTTISVWLWMPMLTLLKRISFFYLKNCFFFFHHLRNIYHSMINLFLHLFPVGLMLTTGFFAGLVRQTLNKTPSYSEDRVRTRGVSTPLPFWLLLTGCQWRDIIFYYIL